MEMADAIVINKADSITFVSKTAKAEFNRTASISSKKIRLDTHSNL
jgi:putative protein kinase ArgK-like GTPase of G3E family